MFILLAEDDFTPRRVLQALLADYGEVHVAANGDEAIEAVTYALDHDTPYQLICLDIHMPGTNGKDVLTRIRALEQAHQISPMDACRVVMITGEQDTKVVMETFRKQADGYLLKPLSKQKLRDLLASFGMEPA